MSVTRCLLRCALLLACGAFAAPRSMSSQSLDLESPMALQALDAPPADQETFGYLLPRLASKYRPSLAWGGVSDPRLYVLTELDDVQESDDPLRPKRKQPSLSIVNPMDVLRQRLLLEIARKHMRENEIQAEKNRVFLKNVGKRDAESSERSFLNNFSSVQKRAHNSKMAEIDRQANVNDYLPNDITVL